MDKISHLFAGLDEDALIEYKQWTRQDGTNLETISSPLGNFIDEFERDIVRYIEHDFINRKQKSYIEYIKSEGLRNRPSLLIQVDFAQNYSMVVQDAVYGFHWNSKAQATLHPFSVTWWDPEANALKEKNYVVISNTMEHDADTFNSFKRKVIAKVLHDFAEFHPNHIFYHSDGAGSQYKNKKNMAHLMEHLTDFKITAEWIFTASSHGKGPCDRVAATVKRTTRIHSLMPGNIITTAKQMYDFCVKKLQSETLVFIYISNEEVTAEKELFEERYAAYKKSIPGTRSFHHFTPLRDGKIRLQKFSGSDGRLIFDFKKDMTPMVDPNDLEITNFYIFVEAGNVQVGMLVDIEEDEIEFQCMTMNKGNKRCRWPKITVFRRVTSFDVILHIREPRYICRGYFELLPEEISAMKERFALFKRRA